MEFKGTKDTVHSEHRNGNQYFYFVNELKQQHFIGQMFYLGDNRRDEFKHNAELTVDAFNTIQSCGLLPSELLKQRDELREMVSRLVGVLTDIDSTLFQHNHKIEGWHLNGDLEPIMNFVADLDIDCVSEAENLIKSATEL